MSYHPDAPHEWTLRRLIDSIINLETGIRQAEKIGNRRMASLLKARRLELLDELNRRTG